MNNEKIYAKPARNADEYSGVLVVGEQHGETLLDVTLELASTAIALNVELKEQCVGAIVGKNICSAAEKFAQAGLDKIFAIETQNLVTDEECADEIARLIEELAPSIVLFGATAFGRSLAPRVAAKMHTGLTADCTVLEIDEQTHLLRQTRPAFGGNLMATIVCPKCRPQMATVRPGVMKKNEMLLQKEAQKCPIIYRKPLQNDKIYPQILEELRAKGGEKLSDYSIIIGVGRGIGSKKNLQHAREIAEKIGAKIACTRPLVDAGWGEYEMQVGQTGQTIAPKIYIACGISGAIQHLAGVCAAETIIAINTDKDAPIFGMATYGIVGDCVECLVKLCAML